MTHTGGAPTLLRAGNLREVRMRSTSEGRRGTLLSPTQEELDQHVPITYVISWIKGRRSRGTGPLNRVLVFRSSTGSGKSTVLPPELYHTFYNAALETLAKNIVCTQPRVLTSREMTERVIPYHTAEALRTAGRGNLEPLVLERNIGFQTGAISRKPVRGIVYMTVGVLMRQLTVMTDEEITQRYGFIIIDEAHERSMEVDNTLWLLRQYLLRQANNPQCPFVVVMSATMDPYLMADYLLREHEPRERYANIIDVAGYTEPITEHFLELTSADLVADTAARVLEIHQQDREGLGRPTRDILVFGAGEMELTAMRDRVEQQTRAFLQGGDEQREVRDFFAANGLLPITLTRKQVQEGGAEYRSVFAPLEELRAPDAAGNRTLPVARRVVFATNVAETGVTIETLGHVIDTGLYKSNEFNPLYGSMVLVTKPVTQFMYQQRRGRVGRVAPGHCYAMYTRETMEQLDEDRAPNMLISDITSGLLSYIIRVGDPVGEFIGRENHELWGTATEFQTQLARTAVDLARMDLLTPPPADLLQYSLERLYVLGLVTENSIPTALGWAVAQMDKISVENARMILAAYAWGACPLDLVTIAAMLETGTPPLDQLPDADYDLWRELSGNDTLLRNLWTFTYHQERLGHEGGAEVEDEVINVPPYEDEPRTVGGGERGTGKRKKSGAKKSGKKGERSQKESGPERAPPENGIAEAAKKRDQYIDALVRLGFNPLTNWERSVYALTGNEDRQDLIAYFTRLKQCIWEGYKLNLAEWDGEKYRSRRAYAVIAGTFVGRFVLYTDLQYKRKGFQAQGLVPLDGYVAVDPNFIYY